MTCHLHRATAESPDSAIVSMTQQHSREHDLVPTPRPSRTGSAVANMTQQHCRSMTRQHCRQHDSTSTSRRGQVILVALLPA
jgi:hypothetical protein